jgi:hypothetical protein
MFNSFIRFFQRSPVGAISAISIGLGAISTVGQAALYNGVLLMWQLPELLTPSWF